MKFPKFSLIHKGQKGFTLIELMIAIAIGGLIAGSVTMTIFQIVDSSGRTSNHMTAVRQVQSAGYWISHDALMAQDVVIADESVDDPDGTRFPFALTWSDWVNNQENTVVYSIVGNEIQRSLSTTDYNGNTTTSTTVVAEFIDSTLDDDGQRKTRCNYDDTDGELTFTVTAQVGAGSAAQIETRTYEVIPRPGS
jgi:prepilin-type N-terminal cleavage/methylation domain-containing protein